MVVLTTNRTMTDRFVPEIRFSSDGPKTNIDVLATATRGFAGGKEVRMPTSRQLFKAKQTIHNGQIVPDVNPITFGCFGEQRDAEGHIVYAQTLGRKSNAGRVRSKTLADVTVDNIPLLLKKILQHRGYSTKYATTKPVGRLQTNTQVYWKEGRNRFVIDINYIAVKRFTVTEFTQLLPTYFTRLQHTTKTTFDRTPEEVGTTWLHVPKLRHPNEYWHIPQPILRDMCVTKTKELPYDDRHKHIKHHVVVDYMFDSQFIKHLQVKIHNARMSGVGVANLK